MDQLRQVNVSAYRNVSDNTSMVTVPIERWLGGYPRFNSTVDQIRQEPDKKKRDEMKKELPAITVSGIFDPGRCDNTLIKHSGFIALDFDKLADPTEAKKLLASIEYVLYAGLSASGRGLWALIPIAYPSLHRQQYAALEADFALLGLVTDPRCINVSRLRFYSYDTRPVWNMNAVPYRKWHKPEPPVLPQPEYHGGNVSALEKLTRLIEETHTDITADYWDWLKLAGALASILGENGRDYFHRISRYYPNYDIREANRQYSACLRNRPGYSENMIFHIAKKYNILLKDQSVIR